MSESFTSPFSSLMLFITHRQHAEALRDAIHSWIVVTTTGPNPLDDHHPMVVQMRAWRDEITRAFVSRTPADDW